VHEADAGLFDGGYEAWVAGQAAAAGDLADEFLPLPVWLTLAFAKYSMGAMPKACPRELHQDDAVWRGQRYSLRALHTPGHTAGHCSYYVPETQALFCVISSTRTTTTSRP
jgi:glyoxylase-like metal-dependent hydrolase (beta-lactamase superfamily II)